MPFGFGKNQDRNNASSPSIESLNENDLREIENIHEMLNPNEEVLVVARHIHGSRKILLVKEYS
jgi:hypothetical protein